MAASDISSSPIPSRGIEGLIRGIGDGIVPPFDASFFLLNVDIELVGFINGLGLAFATFPSGPPPAPTVDDPAPRLLRLFPLELVVLFAAVGEAGGIDPDCWARR